MSDILKPADYGALLTELKAPISPWQCARIKTQLDHA